ncbi:hypothetical protein Q7P37_005878 [Cladosporium fusiforme]
MTDSSQNPLAGLWKPTHLERLCYGPDSVKKHLLECLPKDTSKAFIITGSSLASKTDLIKQVEELLGDKHAGTFSKIGQHAPVEQLDEATELVKKDASIDTIISIEQTGSFLHHVTIPTTLSAAECTIIAGYTDKSGLKTGVADAKLAPQAVIYDSKFALHTPPWLWMSTGMRAMDHAMELMYYPQSTEMPCRIMALNAASDLFKYLPKYKENPQDEDAITRLQLAAFASLGFLGLNLKGGLGLSHVLGYALGSPYQIPHGITSCMTLGHVIKLKAQNSAEDAESIARMAPFIGLTKSGDDKKDAIAVGDAILQLVDSLGLKTTLTEKGVGKDQVHTVTKTATGKESGELYDQVKELVENLKISIASFTSTGDAHADEQCRTTTAKALEGTLGSITAMSLEDTTNNYHTPPPQGRPQWYSPEERERQNKSLVKAAIEGQLPRVLYLLRLGADVDYVDPESDWFTALDGATVQQRMEVVNALIAAGADVNAMTYGKLTRTPALCLAAATGNVDISEALIDAGADLDASDGGLFGTYPLKEAIFSRHSRVVKLLVTAGADIKKTDVIGRNALHWAAENGMEEVVEILLASGADPNKQTHSGETALGIAASRDGSQYQGIRNMLIRAGATPDIRYDRQGSVTQGKPAAINDVCGLTEYDFF